MSPQWAEAHHGFPAGAVGPAHWLWSSTALQGLAEFWPTHTLALLHAAQAHGAAPHQEGTHMVGHAPPSTDFLQLRASSSSPRYLA